MKKQSHTSRKRAPSTSRDDVDKLIDESVADTNEEEYELAEAVRRSVSTANPTPDGVREKMFFDTWKASNGFTMRRVSGDGHCQFRCMHFLFGRIGDPSGAYYRRIAADEMRGHADFYAEWQIFDEFGQHRSGLPSPEEYRTFLDALERGTNSRGEVMYGDYLSLFALSRVYNVVFRVVCGDGSTASVPDPEPDDARPRHYLSFHQHMYAGPHYNLLLPMGATPRSESMNPSETVQAPHYNVLLPRPQPHGHKPPDKAPSPQVADLSEFYNFREEFMEPNSEASEQLSQFRDSEEKDSFPQFSFPARRQRIIKPHYLNEAVICASQGRRFSGSDLAETFQWYERAVHEVREALKLMSRDVVWMPSSRGTDRNAMSYSNAHHAHSQGDDHIAGEEQQALFNAVLTVKPTGALKKFLDETKAWNMKAEAELKNGRLPSLNKSYLRAPSARNEKRTIYPHTAPSQQFRVTLLEGSEPSSAESRQHVQNIIDAERPSVRKCRVCHILLLGSSHNTPFAERDKFCCDSGSRLHDFWHPLPEKFNKMVFTKCARVINCLLSPTTIHGAPDEGLGYRHLSYQAPVMTIHGQMYSRFMRCPSNCWFLQDATFDKRMFDLLNNDEQKKVLMAFHGLLVQNHSLRHVLLNGIDIHQAMQTENRVWVTMDEDTRMCAVYVSPDVSSMSGRRQMYVLGANTTIQEDQPEWELLAYPIMHFRGDETRAWYRGKRSYNGSNSLTLTQYLRSIILTQPGFWKFGRLAEQFVLDTWARQEQMNMAAMRSEVVQGKLREYARACNRSFGPEKVFLPANVPGSYAYQRRFFHDVLHISRSLGASHLFVTFTCNPNWAEVTALLGGVKPDLTCESHQATIARVFVAKRKQLIARLSANDYLFPGHRGVVWLVYSTEWQKGDLPHAHIALRLNIDTTIQPMATQMDQINLMDKIVCARKPPRDAEHYHHVMAFMQHPEVCKSCMKQVKGAPPGEKRCRFRFPKPEAATSRIDMKGFPVYARGPGDVRIVPYNSKTLIEFKAHINYEYTFLSHHFAYLYSYMCKGVDHGGFRIRDQDDEIAAHHKARILTPGECVYKILGYNVNYRNPPVIVCHIHLPRDRNSHQGEEAIAGFDEALAHGQADVFGDQYGEDVVHETREAGDTGDVAFAFDFLDEYFRADRSDDQLFCDFYCEKYRYKCPRTQAWQWMIRKEKNRVLARMPWYPPMAGPIFFLRLLLLHVPARGFTDLFGTHGSFREHCLALGLIEDGKEYLHGMRDSIESGRSPAECRHLFALFVNCADTIHLGELWADSNIRRYLSDDFLPSEANGDEVKDDEDTIYETASNFALMDIASMVEGMGSDDFHHLFENKGLPELAPKESMSYYHSKVGGNVTSTRVFQAYAAVVGYSIVQRAVVPATEREVLRFREKTKIPSQDDLAQQFSELNSDQKQLFRHLMTCFEMHRSGNVTPQCFLHNINASAGCGKTFLMNRVIAAVRATGAITASVCSIGIGALLFDDGRTVHNLFKIPIHEEKDVLEGLNLISSLNKTLDLGKTNGRIEFLKAVSFLTWDEIGTIKSNVFLAVDHLMRRVKRSSLPFGGCFVVTTGDWKQCPPVDDENERVRFWDGDEEAFVSIANLSVKTCKLYVENFNKLSLSINERAKHDPPFNEFVRQLGVGDLRGDVSLQTFPFRTFETVEECCEWLYETDIPSPYRPVTVSQRCILSPFNKTVDMINEYCEQRSAHLKGEQFHMVTLLSVDELICPEEQSVPVRQHIENNFLAAARRNEVDNLRADLEGADNTRGDDEDWGHDQDAYLFDVRDAVESARIDNESFCTEILNVMNFPGTPPHKLRLWIGCVVILLRNLDPANRLQNGVRLIVKDFVRGNKVIAVVKAEDEKAYEENGGPPPQQFLLHRIKFQCSFSRSSKDATITRKQFPVRLANAVSVHKSQSMTMARTVFDVREGAFEHGQCFVAFSRNRSSKDLALLIHPGQKTFRNIVIDTFVEDN